MNSNTIYGGGTTITDSVELVNLNKRAGYNWLQLYYNIHSYASSPSSKYFSGGVYYIWYGNSYFGWYGSGISVYLSIYVPSSIAVGGNIYMTSSKKVKKI